MSSIYTECGDAARRLLDDPSLRISTEGVPGIFTELDVIFLAAREHSRQEGRVYSDDEMRLAQREASQVMGAMFRNRKAVRFGPVVHPKINEPDYMRVASKIVYAPADGPEEIKTPNGTFKRMFVHDDDLTRSGRRVGADRNDLEPWEGQSIMEPTPKPVTAEQREILRLRAENAALQAKLTETTTELHRLRGRAVESITRAEVKDVIAAVLAEQQDAGKKAV